MYRFILAWKCFFLVLFARRLPDEARVLLPPPELIPTGKDDAQAELETTLERPLKTSEIAAVTDEKRDEKAELETTLERPLRSSDVLAAAKAQAAEQGQKGDGKSAPATTDAASAVEQGALALLALLQREGRLVDFLQEEIETYGDAQIGAAVRDIHRGCKKALAEHLALEPVLPQPDNSTVRVEPGFDPSRIRLVGEVVGQPPFTGTLRHPGWRAKKVELPKAAAAQDPTVVAPAEVELGGGA